MTPPFGRDRWVVVREGQVPRWGGELRRRNIFSVLAERTGATVVDGWTSRALIAGTRGPRWRSVLRSIVARPHLASSEQLSERVIPYAERFADPVAVAIYDDAVAQLGALGIELEPDRLEGIRRRLDHLAWLGVDAVWISPFFRSPMKDYGYDVSDFCDGACDIQSGNAQSEY